jgi:hypothetical protein
MSVHRLLVASLLGGLVCFAARPTRAIERQHHIGIDPTVGALDIKDKSTLSIGVGPGIHYAYGLTDQFNITADASAVVVAANQEQDDPTSPRNRPATVTNASAGVGYVIDILRWVPYLGVQAGGYMLTGGTLPDPLFVFGGSAQIGLDYQLSREMAIGISGRQHFLLTKLATYPSYSTFGIRLEYMWGY